MVEPIAGRARQSQIDQLTGELSRLHSAPQYHYELLLALGRAAPDTVVLESVTTQGADFVIAGRMEDAGTPPGEAVASSGARSRSIAM